MGLRCFLFSSDQGTIASIGQILKGLDIEAESCSEAVTAVDKIANSVFQIVIVDWDKQAEAALLLSAARERKASERPVTLAISAMTSVSRGLCKPARTPCCEGPS